jgi:CheY-like chemotaxis protein
MTLESLLLSSDPEVVRVLGSTLENLAISVEIRQEALSGNGVLTSEKFDAVIVDCEMEGGLEILQSLRTLPSNRNSVAFAILNGKKTTTQQAFGMGANFVMQKPISPLNASRCLNAALNFMVRERRRYFRQSVKMLVRAVLEDREWKATSTNISEGGIALILRDSIPDDSTPRLQFALPGVELAMEVEAEVAWADGNGSVGFRFRKMPRNSREILEKWLNEQMEKEFPGSLERIAAAEQEPTH